MCLSSDPNLSAETMSESEIVYRDPETYVFFNHVTTPLPLLKYKDGKTCVFWDVDDYTIPNGHDPLWMKDKIEQALKNQGYFGEISVQAYFDKNMSSTELQTKYSDADIKLCPLSEGSKYAKAVSMFVDVVMWAYNNKYKSNMIVLSKKIEKETCSMAEGLFDRGYCILLSTSRPDWWYGPSESETCFLASLFDGGTPSGRSLDNNKPKREAAGNPKFRVSAAAASNMETLFPKSDRMSCVGRDTLVLLEMDSFDTIPKDPWNIIQHIRSLLMKEGYGGFVSFEVMFVDDNTFPDDDLKNIYEESEIFIPLKGGDKAATYDLMLTTILYWAFNYYDNEPSNLLVISDNPNFGQGKFAAIRESLEKKDFKVAVTQLESVMNLSAL